MIQNTEKNQIMEAVVSIDSISDDLAVLLVVNVKDDRILNQGDTRFSILAEYFSEDEVDEIIIGFRGFVNYIDISYGETEFVNKLSSGFFSGLTQKHKIVYSSTGSGIRKCKSSLIPNLCDFYNLPYCSNDAYTSAILENKVHAFSLLKYYGFPIAPFWVYDYKNGWHKNEMPRIDIRLIAKPAYQCSSIGIDENSVSYMNVKFQEHIDKLSREFNEPIIIQQFIKGFEVEIPVIDIDAIVTPLSLGVSINDKHNLGDLFLTYDTICGGDFHYFNFDEENDVLAQKLKRVAQQSYTIFDLVGIARVDFRITDAGEYFITDYNNTPHLTLKNACAKAFIFSGFTYSDMLKCLLFGGYSKIKKRSISGGRKTNKQI
jgi:D-alanine-D-alanine ligase